MKFAIVLSFSAAVLVISDPKAVPFGSPAHIHTLLSPAGSHPKLLDPSLSASLKRHNRTRTEIRILYENHASSSDDGDENETDDKQDGEEYDKEMETMLSSTGPGITPNFRWPEAIFNAAKRQAMQAPRNCGTWIMNCYIARGACNNACYYQNCVNRGTPIMYLDHGNDKRTASDNRKLAGTTTSTKPPCRVLPLSQKFWDSWPNWLQTDPDLETDEYVRRTNIFTRHGLWYELLSRGSSRASLKQAEPLPESKRSYGSPVSIVCTSSPKDMLIWIRWPMAAMAQPGFQQGVVRNTLRCIPQSENGGGGNQLSNFRSGNGDYAPLRSNNQPGRYSQSRTCTGSIQAGDTYSVDFDLSQFTPQEIDTVVPYCKPNPVCANDSRQFHMSKYVPSTRGPSAATIRSGVLKWIWDIDTMNNYELTGEGQPVEAFQILLQRTGPNQQDVNLIVSKYRNQQHVQAGQVQQNNVADNTRLIVSGLPRDLTFWHNNGLTYFEYGDQNRDGIAFFPFNTGDMGFGAQFTDKTAKTHRYCAKTSIPGGNQWECWFAGW